MRSSARASGTLVLLLALFAAAQSAEAQPAPEYIDDPCATTCYDEYPEVWYVVDPGKPERREGGDSYFPMPVGPGDELEDPQFEIAPDDLDEPMPVGQPEAPGDDAAAPGGDVVAPAPMCTPVAPVPPRPSWTEAPLPDLGVIGADPIIKGLTGLESRFWWSGQDAIGWTQTGQPGVTADCTPLPPPTATFTARVVRWDWDVRETTESSYRPGTPFEPAVRHMYETKDFATVVEVDLLWVGDPPGSVSTPGGRRAHPVIEVRSVLTG